MSLSHLTWVSFDISGVRFEFFKISRLKNLREASKKGKTWNLFSQFYYTKHPKRGGIWKLNKSHFRQLLVNAPRFPSGCLAVLSPLWWFWTFRIDSAACHLRPYWRHSESLDEKVLRGPTIVCIFLPSFQWDIWIYSEHFIFRTVMHSEPKRRERKKRTIIVETIGNVLMKLHTAEGKAIHA